MKICHLSDNHLDITAKRLGKLRLKNGENSTYLERLALTEYIIYEGLKQNVDLFIDSGDIFDKPKPYPREYEDLKALLYAIPDKTPIFIISGNHDEPSARGCAIKTLEGVKSNLHVVSELTEIEYQGQYFILAPWGVTLEQIKRMRDGMKDKPVLVYHAGVWSREAHWVEVTGETANVTLSDLQGLDCKAILLGHHHGQEQIDKHIWYASCPEVLDFGEENQRKGFLIWEVNKDVEVTPFSTADKIAKFKTLGIEEFLDLKDGMDFAYVRVKGEVTDQERLEVVKKLQTFPCLDYSIDLESKVKYNRVSELKGDNDVTILRNYLMEKGYEDIDDLIKLDKEI